jgi:hypothetical protein
VKFLHPGKPNARRAVAALLFCALGYPLVVLFSAAATLAFAGALLVFAHHAATAKRWCCGPTNCRSSNGKAIACGRSACAARACGPVTEPPRWWAAGTARVQVGRYLRPGPRERFVPELQRALQTGDDLRARTG